MVNFKIPVLLFLSIFILLPSGCSPDEKNRVRNDIKDFKLAVEQKKSDEVLQYIAPDYSDPNGMTYDQFVDVINNMARQLDDIKITMKDLTIKIDSVAKNNTIFASCSLGLRITARHQEERVLLYGGLVKPMPVRAFFKKTKQTYQIYYAEY